MKQQIEPAALRTLRKRMRQGRGMSQEELARHAKVSKRQIQRIESHPTNAGPMMIQESTLAKLATALKVLPKDLQREDPELPVANRLERPVSLRPEVWANLALVQSAYGADLETVLELAPLLFTYHAESSLRLRRKRLNGQAELFNQLRRVFPKLDELGDGHGRGQNALSSEDESIRQGDVFGVELGNSDEGEIQLIESPFILYLQNLSHDFANSSKLEVDGADPGIVWPRSESRVPQYTVCSDHLDWLTGGDPALKQGIMSMKINIEQMDSSLRFDRDARMRWLREQLNISEGSSATAQAGSGARECQSEH